MAVHIWYKSGQWHLLHQEARWNPSVGDGHHKVAGSIPAERNGSSDFAFFLQFTPAMILSPSASHDFNIIFPHYWLFSVESYLPYNMVIPLFPSVILYGEGMDVLDSVATDTCLPFTSQSKT